MTEVFNIVTYIVCTNSDFIYCIKCWVFVFAGYMKNAYHKGDHVIFVHCPEYHTVVQSRKSTDTAASLFIQGSKVRGLTFEGQNFDVSWYIQKTTSCSYDAVFTLFSIQLLYKGTYNNWCSEFTKRHHNWVYLGLGRLKVGIVFGLKD